MMKTRHCGEENEGSYLKRGNSARLYEKWNIFESIQDMKNPRLGFCRVKLGLFLGEKIWSTSVD